MYQSIDVIKKYVIKKTIDVIKKTYIISKKTEIYNEKAIQVSNHCHLTGKRKCAAHKKCNVNLRISN